MLSRREIRDSCVTNKETGELECERKQVHKDGTASDIAGFKMSVTADCLPVMTEAFENEPNSLDQLEKRFASKVIAKCRKTGRNIPQEI